MIWTLLGLLLIASLGMDEWSARREHARWMREQQANRDAVAR